MDPLVVGEALDAEVGDGVVLSGSGVAGDAGEICRDGAPEDALEVETGVAGGAGFAGEVFEGCFGFFYAAEAVDEGGEFVDGEDGLAVDFVVVWLGEVVADDVVDHGVEGGAVDGAAPVDLAFIGGGGVEVAGVVVIGPHEVEAHAVAVGGFEEAVVEGVFEEGFSVVPVPVVDEDIDAVGCGGVDFLRDGFGVGFVGVAPERDAGAGGRRGIWTGLCRWLPTRLCRL